jgi:hypothetical protein
MAAGKCGLSWISLSILAVFDMAVRAPATIFQARGAYLSGMGLGETAVFHYPC